MDTAHLSLSVAGQPSLTSKWSICIQFIMGQHKNSLWGYGINVVHRGRVPRSIYQ